MELHPPSSVAIVSTAEAGMAVRCSWADDSMVDVPTGLMLPVTKQNLSVGWAILQEIWRNKEKAHCVPKCPLSIFR